MYTLSINQKSAIRQYIGLAITVGLILSAVLVASLWAKPEKAHAYNLVGAQLGLGSRGANVSSLQAFLASNPLIYPQGLVTGYFGPLTASAVGQFQLSYNIPMVGRVGHMTLAKINSLVSTGQGIDVSGPSIVNLFASVSGVVSNQSVRITWQTDENARAKVFYSTTPISEFETSAAQTEPQISGTMWNDTSLGASKDVTISDLTAHTTYYYVVEAIDAQGNVSLSPQSAFQTM